MLEPVNQVRRLRQSPAGARLRLGFVLTVLGVGAFLFLNVVGLDAQQVSSQPRTTAEAPAEIQTLKITVLSTMLVGEREGIGEWGFSALVEADGHRILVDTGLHPETVLQNARDLNIDLSTVREVILTHNHGDHVGGLMTLRREMMKKNPDALSVVHVGKGIFYSRPSPQGEDNEMIAIRKEYEATGGKFIEHDEGAVIFPGAWLTGPVPRKYPEHNWSVTGKVQTPDGPGRRQHSRRPVPGSQHTSRPGGSDWLRACGHCQHPDLYTQHIFRSARVRNRGRHPFVSGDRPAVGLDRRRIQGLSSCEPLGGTLYGHRGGVSSAGACRNDAKVGSGRHGGLNVYVDRRNCYGSAGEVNAAPAAGRNDRPGLARRRVGWCRAAYETWRRSRSSSHRNGDRLFLALKPSGCPEMNPSLVGTWLSLVEHSLGVRGVGSSNLPVPTNQISCQWLVFSCQPVLHGTPSEAAQTTVAYAPGECGNLPG